MKKLLLLSGCVILIGCGTAINEINLKERDLPSYCVDIVRADNFLKHQSKALSDSRYRSGQYKQCTDLVMEKIKKD